MRFVLSTAAVALALLLTACAPQLYKRSTVTLDSREDESLMTRYGELDGCLFKHQLPVEYTLRRPRYTLVLRPIAAMQDAKPRIEIRLQADASVSLTVTSVDRSPEPLYAESGARYVVDTGDLRDKTLALSLTRSGEVLGTERFGVDESSCRVLSP